MADALRILNFDQWYASSAGLKGLGVVQLWLEEEERALAEGYNGLRITGNTRFLEPAHWSTFMQYEQAVTARFNGRRIVALCSHSLAQFSELASERIALSELTRTLEQRVQELTGELMGEVAARERAQEQLLQSQKMECIGQLTGGVAHDFNNLLTAVMGNLELLRKRLPDDPRAQHLIDGAIKGAERGSSLTQRMLAFARQQDLQTSSADVASLLVGKGTCLSGLSVPGLH
jgi:signal transduction histidine kinase